MVDYRSSSYKEIAASQAKAREEATKKKKEEQSKSTINIKKSSIVTSPTTSQVAIKGTPKDNIETTYHEEVTTPTTQSPPTTTVETTPRYEDFAVKAGKLQGQSVSGSSVGQQLGMSVREDKPYTIYSTVERPQPQEKKTFGVYRQTPEADSPSQKFRQAANEASFKSFKSKDATTKIGYEVQAAAFGAASVYVQPFTRPYEFVKDTVVGTYNVFTKPFETGYALKEQALQSPGRTAGELAGGYALGKTGGVIVKPVTTRVANKMIVSKVGGEASVSSNIDFGQNLAIIDDAGSKVYSGLEVGQSTGLYKVGNKYYRVQALNKGKSVILDENSIIKSDVSDFEITNIKYGLRGAKNKGTTSASLRADTIITRAEEGNINSLSLANIQVGGISNLKAVVSKGIVGDDTTFQSGASFITNKKLSEVTPEMAFASRTDKVAVISDVEGSLGYTKTISESKMLSVDQRKVPKMDIKPSSEQLRSLKIFNSEGGSQSVAGSKVVLKNDFSFNLENQAPLVVKEVFKSQVVSDVKKVSTGSGVVVSSVNVNTPVFNVGVTRQSNVNSDVSVTRSVPLMDVGVTSIASVRSLKDLSVNTTSRSEVSNITRGASKSLIRSKSETALKVVPVVSTSLLSDSVQLSGTIQRQTVVPKIVQQQSQKSLTKFNAQRIALDTPVTNFKTPFGKLFNDDGDGFGVQVRRRGEFRTIGRGLSLREAQSKGLGVVRNSAAATYRITKQGQPFRVSSPGRGFYTKGELVIERPSYRIKSSGELNEITYVGIRSQKRRGLL